ncbi:MAG TPA: DNA phosphorothioation system sulfurtransferase DndC [Pyrinomonadaceae bacterium]|jgi:DNA sulfur modification protein DndC
MVKSKSNQTEGTTVKRAKSAFDEYGFKETIARCIDEIKELYLSDEIPWVVGYSGGKDSTAVLQLVWLALLEIEESNRKKTVHVISTDTLVENPIVASWVNQSLERMREAAVERNAPVKPHRLTPEVTDSFWVNLIGKGYPAPRPKFRWCTERLKINPSNEFITSVVRESGEAILVLGTRKAESTVRARNMEKHARFRTRERLSPSGTLTNCLIFSPVEDWSNDDVWLFLMQVANPWGYNNKDLLTMYQGASPDGECPLVVDTTTPSCGDSRFGCWVCTLVDQDKSMHAMIQNDEEKEWMLPLLELRNDLDVADDRHLRDFRRMNGLVQIFNGRNIPGPYIQSVREHWLRRVLEAQAWVRANGPDYVRKIDLVTLPELQEIRRIWITEKHELEDSLPRIYEEVTGEAFPKQQLDDNLVFGAAEIEILKEICGDDQLHFELARELLDVEQRFRTQARRAGLYDALESAFRRNFYTDVNDATERALMRKGAMDAAKAGDYQQLPLISPNSADSADQDRPGIS